MAKFLHILVVDSDADVCEVIRLMLSELGYRVSTARNIDAARPLLDRLDVDLLVSDERPNVKEWELADYARSLGIPTLMMSAFEDTKHEHEREGGVGFIGKPFRLKTFQDRLQRVLERPHEVGDDC